MPVILDLQEKEFRFIEAILLLFSFTLTFLSEHFKNEFLKVIVLIIIMGLIGLHYYFKLKKDEHVTDKFKKIKDGVI